MSIFEFVVVLKDFFLVVFVYNIFQNGWSSDCHHTNIMTHILVAVWLFANVLVTHTVISSVFQSIFTIQILFFSSCLIVFFSLSLIFSFPFSSFYWTGRDLLAEKVPIKVHALCSCLFLRLLFSNFLHLPFFLESTFSRLGIEFE